MAKGNVDLTKIQAAIDAIQELMDEFDPSNPEDVNVRVDAFVSLLTDSGVIRAASERSQEMDFEAVVKALKLKRSSGMLLQINTFLLDIASYDREPNDAEMDEAQELLGEFGPAVIADLTTLRDEWARKQN